MVDGFANKYTDDINIVGVFLLLFRCLATAIPIGRGVITILADQILHSAEHDL